MWAWVELLSFSHLQLGLGRIDIPMNFSMGKKVKWWILVKIDHIHGTLTKYLICSICFPSSRNLEKHLWLDTEWMINVQYVRAHLNSGLTKWWMHDSGIVFWRFSTAVLLMFLMLLPFNTVPQVVMTPITKPFCCYFIIIILYCYES